MCSQNGYGGYDCMLSVAGQSSAQNSVWSLCIHVAGLKGQSLQGVRSTWQFHLWFLTHKRVWNSWRHTEHMSASCEVCPTWELVNKQMNMVPLWGNVKEAADTATRGSHGVHQYLSWLLLKCKQRRGRAALLCWDEDGESWSQTRVRDIRCERKDGAWDAKVSISLLCMLLCATAPGWGFKGKAGLKAQQNAWGASPLCAPQRHLISVFQTVVCTSGVLITAWSWAVYDIYHPAINIISS